jgi:hypothetical protein
MDKMNYRQISFHLDYLLEKIKNNFLEEEFMPIVHSFSGYFQGNRNYMDDLVQHRISKYGLLCRLKEDLCDQYIPGPNNGAVALPPGANAIQPQVIKDFVVELCKIVYQK